MDNFISEKDKDKEREPEAEPKAPKLDPGAEPAAPEARGEDMPGDQAEAPPEGAAEEEPVYIGNIGEGENANWIRHARNREGQREELAAHHEIMAKYYAAQGDEASAAQQMKLVAILRGEEARDEFYHGDKPEGDEPHGDGQLELDAKDPAGNDIEPGFEGLDDDSESWGTGVAGLDDEEDDWGV